MINGKEILKRGDTSVLKIKNQNQGNEGTWKYLSIHNNEWRHNGTGHNAQVKFD
jgi:hypothetical protein